MYPGQRPEIAGKDPTGFWFLVTDEHGRELWVAGESAVVMGVSSQILTMPVEGQRINAKAAPVYIAPTRARVFVPTDTPVPVIPVSRGGFPYELVGTDVFTTDYATENIVRFLVWVHDQGGVPASGVSFVVKHNGAIIQPTNQSEFVSGSAVIMSWPRNTGNRQRPYNAKIEVRDVVDPTGTWIVYPLAQGIAANVGVQAGPPYSFEVTKDDVASERLEFYLGYAKRTPR